MRTVRGLAFHLAVSSSPLLAGCDGESAFPLPVVDAGLPDARYQAACSAWARSRCGCVGAVGWANEPQCVSRETLACELLGSDPNVPFDAVRVATCAPPDAAACPVATGDYCLAPGLASLGEPCLSYHDCQSANCVHGYDPRTVEFAVCGTCQPPMIPCNGPCPAGQSCVLQPNGGTMCVRNLGQPGDRCAGPQDCSRIAYCAPTGVCAALPALGQACGDGGASAGGLPCGAANLYCDGTGHCQQYAIVYVDYGEPCGAAGTHFKACGGSGVCDVMEHLCRPPAADGEICAPAQGLGCLSPAECVSNRCILPSFAMCGGGGHR